MNNAALTGIQNPKGRKFTSNSVPRGEGEGGGAPGEGKKGKRGLVKDISR